MKKKITKILLSFLLCLGIVSVFHSAYAITCDSNSTDQQCLQSLDPTPVQSLNGVSAFNNIVNTLINRIPAYLGGLAFLAILYTGGIYLISMGSPDKMELAKKNLLWTIYGIVAVSGIYAIIAVILWLTNVTVVR